MQTQKFTLSEIKQLNLRAGYFFFTRSTMKFFGDTMKSFAVRHREGKVLIERVRPMYNSRGHSMGGTGDLREFDPQTGDIGPVLNKAA